MIREIGLLLKLKYCNLFGFNEAKKAKGKKVSAIATTIAMVFVCLIMCFYVGLLSYLFCMMGLARVVPVYLCVLTSIIVLSFTIFKAGGELFDLRSYEVLAPFPLKKSSIIASKLLGLYITDAALSLLVFISGGVGIVIFESPEFAFYPTLLLGAVLVPLLPLCVACFLGAGVYALTSKLKKAKLISSILIMLLTIVIIVVPSFIPDDISGEEVTSAIDALALSIGRIYPPALWFSEGVWGTNYLNFALFALLSVAVSALFVFVFSKVYKGVCTALASTSSNKQKADIKKGSQATPLKAFYKKEIKRLFSSTIYVTNTLVGNLMAIIASVVLVIPSQEISGLGGVGVFGIILVIALGMIANLSPTTSASISLEGKNWDTTKSLPVDKKIILNAKLLVNLTFALPTSIIASILIALSPISSGAPIWFVLITPTVFSVFMSIVGLFMNVKSPNFNWSNETQPVKQGKPVLFAMLVDFGVGLASIVLCTFAGVVGMIITPLICIGLSVLFYKLTTDVDLREIN